MALEASDIGDNHILSNTKRMENGNGQVQFRITLPSGRELESEWLQPDMQKKAMVAWLDVVKAEAVADADLVRMAAREKAMSLAKAAANDVQQAPVQTQDAVYTAPLPQRQPSVTTGSGDTARSAGLGPDSFVEQGLQAADNEVEYWTQQAATATVRLLKAQQERIKWSQIKAALSAQGANTGNGSQDSDSQGNSRRSAGRVGGTRRRKRTAALPRFADDDTSKPAASDVRASDNGV